MSGDKPTGAMVLSIIGGLFILLGGVLIVFASSLLGSLTGGSATYDGVNISNYTSLLTALGAVGAVIGILTILVGIWAYMKPAMHVVAGVLLIIFAILSAFFALYGLFIGLLLTFIAGILALVFKPSSSAPKPQSNS